MRVVKSILSASVNSESERGEGASLCSAEQKAKVRSAYSKFMMAILGLRHAGIRIIRRFKKSRCE